MFTVTIYLKSEAAAKKMFNSFKKRFPKIKSDIETKQSKYGKKVVRLLISNLEQAQLAFITTVVYGY